MKAPEIVVRLDYGHCWGLRRMLACGLAFVAGLLLRIAAWLVLGPVKIEVFSRE